jgi:transposase
MGTRRQFSREFKVEAVKLVKERGVSMAQAAKDLEIHQTMVRAWIRELAGGGGLLTSWTSLTT